MSRLRGAPLRVLCTGPGEPAYNLALDAVLLESAGTDVLRLYAWQPFGLSIGRFQDAAAFEHVVGSHVMVRRQTGGGAIYHGDEITFSIAVDAEAYWPTEVAYARVHDAIVRALDRVGVRARRLREGPPALGARALREAWCFAAPACLDIVAPDGRKLCGSAQRRVARPDARVLHHGSIVLRRPAATPFCAAVADQADVDDVRDALSDTICDEIAAALGRSAEADVLESDERTRAEELAVRFRSQPGAPA